MTSYFLTFIVYTSAMVGAIFLALFVYKKFAMNKTFSNQSKFLAVEDCINIGLRKQLFVIKAGNEKFLIASDAERTTFLSKLNPDNKTKTDINEIFEKNIDFINTDNDKKINNDEEIFFLNDINKSSKRAGDILRNIAKSGGKV